MNTILAIFILVNIVISAFGVITLFFVMIGWVDDDLGNDLRETFYGSIRKNKGKPISSKIVLTIMWVITFLLAGHIGLISFIIGALSIIKNNKK